MIVLKSTFDKTAKLAKAACISRDLWKCTAETYLSESTAWKQRALDAEAKVARMTGGLKQNKAKAA